MGDVLRQKLESDKAIEARVLGFVDYAHATAANLFDNAVVGDGLPDERVAA